MTIVCNMWMICLELNWFFYGLSRRMQFSEFVWALSYSVWDVFNNFLVIDATNRIKISSDKKRFFIALSLYPLSFFVNTPFKLRNCDQNYPKKNHELNLGKIPPRLTKILPWRKLSPISQIWRIYILNLRT